MIGQKTDAYKIKVQPGENTNAGADIYFLLVPG